MEIGCGLRGVGCRVMRGFLQPTTFSPLPTTFMEHLEIDRIIHSALNEDLGRGDITTQLLIPFETQMIAHVVAREPMVVAGIDVARRVYELLGNEGAAFEDLPQLVMERRVDEGASVVAGERLLTLQGTASLILTGERTALNLLNRMCSVATQTARFVAAVQGTKAKILDTRKTMPGLRLLDKYAVGAGGGMNHRMRLDDAILIKDNHIAACGSVKGAVEQAVAGANGLPVIVECDTLEQVQEVLGCRGVTRILLDNMKPEQLLEAVKRVGGKLPLEASGGVTLETVRAIAETGVDFISVGRLTQGVPAVDIGLDVE